MQDTTFDDVDSDEEEDVEAYKAFVAPRKGDYVLRSDDTTVISLQALSFRGDKQLTAHLQTSSFLTDDTEVGFTDIQCCFLGGVCAITMLDSLQVSGPDIQSVHTLCCCRSQHTPSSRRRALVSCSCSWRRTSSLSWACLHCCLMCRGCSASSSSRMTCKTGTEVLPCSCPSRQCNHTHG